MFSCSFSPFRPHGGETRLLINFAYSYHHHFFLAIFWSEEGEEAMEVN